MIGALRRAFKRPDGNFWRVALRIRLINDLRNARQSKPRLAAKNAILIVEFAKARADNNMEPVQAALESARLRLRPILMTSLAFIIGCLPLAIASGAGSAARNEMGVAVVGGMIFCQRSRRVKQLKIAKKVCSE